MSKARAQANRKTHPDASVLEINTGEHEAPHFQDDGNETTAHFLMDDDEEFARDDEFDQADIDIETKQAWRPRRRLYFIIIGMLVLVFAYLVGMSVNKKRQQIWSAPSGSDVDGKIFLNHFIRTNLPSNSVRAIDHNDASSPQHKALTWMIEDPTLSTYPVWKLRQRYALATFYYSMSGANWSYYGNNSSWLSYGVDECDWYSSEDMVGHTDPACAENGAYRSLHLSDLNLGGQLPDELELLSGLESIILVSDQVDITGRLPSGLGSLASPLHTLILIGMGLGGEIPDSFAHFTGLHQVDLYRNFLSGPLPIPVLSAWRNLIDLNLGTNLFTGRITDVDDIVFEHWRHSLVSLDWSDNSLSGSIGRAIGNHLTSLESLRLMDNDLEGEIPENLKLLSQLQELTLFKNRLTGEIPTHLAELQRLHTLDIGGNFLTGTIPTEIGSLGQLIDLNLAENDLHGSIPSRKLCRAVHLVTSNDALTSSSIVYTF
jgi:Leucine-rich repeat (LRR) protein